MSHTGESFKTLREGYRGLPDEDKIMFWIHFAVAPALMGGAMIYAFGWPIIVFIFGWLLWKGSES